MLWLLCFAEPEMVYDFTVSSGYSGFGVFWWALRTLPTVLSLILQERQPGGEEKESEDKALAE